MLETVFCVLLPGVFCLVLLSIALTIIFSNAKPFKDVVVAFIVDEYQRKFPKFSAGDLVHLLDERYLLYKQPWSDKINYTRAKGSEIYCILTIKALPRTEQTCFFEGRQNPFEKHQVDSLVWHSIYEMTVLECSANSMVRTFCVAVPLSAHMRKVT